MASGKDTLLSWCKQKIRQCRLTDSSSISFNPDYWENGIAFCALIHPYQPKAFNLSSLKKENGESNLKLAFDTAESLGIPKLIEEMDFVERKVDKTSIIAYLSSLYQFLERGEVSNSALREKNESQKAKGNLRISFYSNRSIVIDRAIDRFEISFVFRVF